MVKRKKLKKFISSLLVLFLFFTSVLAVSASNIKSVDENNNKYCKERRKENTNIKGSFSGRHDEFKKIIEVLVKDKSISKKTGESIIRYTNERKQTIKNMSKDEKREYLKINTKGRDLINELVEAKIITQDEGEIIRKKVIAVREAKLNKFLESLVSERIIDSSQLEEIKIYFKELRNERKVIYERTKNMTVEERKEYFRDYKSKRTNPLDDMVNKNIITKEQRDKIVEKFKKEFKHHKELKKSEERFLMFKKLRSK